MRIVVALAQDRGARRARRIAQGEAEVVVAGHARFHEQGVQLLRLRHQRHGAGRIQHAADGRTARRRRLEHLIGNRRCGGGAARLAGRVAEERARVRIAGREGQDAAVHVLRLATLAHLDEDARHLLEHRDGLALLIERLERLGQEAERVNVARIRLEAGLELLQRAARIGAAQVQVGQLAVERHVVRLVPEQPLGHLDEVVEPVVLAQVVAGLAELGDRVVNHALFRVELGQLDAGGDVLRIEIDQLADGGQRLARLALAMEVRRHHLEVLHRVREQAELAVELGQLEVDLNQPRIELEDLLVDRDGLQVEALLAVELGDAEIGLRGLVLRALLGVEIADLEPDPDVLRVLADDLEVLLDGLVNLALVPRLAGCVHHLVLVDGHQLVRGLYPASTGTRTRRAGVRKRDHPIASA